MSKEWSEKVQGIKSLDITRETRFSYKIMERIADSIHAENKMKILDSGCGTGTLTRKLAMIYPDSEITGLDLDLNFIEYCQEKAKRMEIRNIKYDQGDVLKTGYPDDFFDVCTSHTLIEHVDNGFFLREQLRICKPGGYVSVMNVRPESSMSSGEKQATERENELIGRLSGNAQQVKEKLRVGKYFTNPQNIMKEFENTGFKEIQFDVIPYVSCIDDVRNSREEKLRLIEAQFAPIFEFIDLNTREDKHLLTGKEKEELLELVGKRYKKRIGQLEHNEHVWDFTLSPMIIITGRKI